jgi:short-subunit dehydrogenase
VPNLKGHRAVVTGASSGIGLEMARLLAHWGCDLCITARRRDRLEALAEELRKAHGVRVDIVALDLAGPEAPARLCAAAYAAGEVDILVNNAGLGAYHRFADDPWERSARLLQLNVTALVELTHRFLVRMRARDRASYILNVASLVAYMPIPYFANYAASKAYVRSFSESLAAELTGENVSVTCLCPGATRTEFTDVAGQKVPRGGERMMMSPARCARIGLRAMLRRRRNVLPGFSNRLIAFFAWLVPRRVMAAVVGATLGKPTAALPPADAPAPR